MIMKYTIPFITSILFALAIMILASVAVFLWRLRNGVDKKINTFKSIFLPIIIATFLLIFGYIIMLSITRNAELNHTSMLLLILGTIILTIIIICSRLVCLEWETVNKKISGKIKRWQSISILLIMTVGTIWMIKFSVDTLTTPTPQMSLEYQLASIDAGQYVKHGGIEEQRAKDAITNALSVCNATPEQITRQAIKLSNILTEDNMPTRPIEILEGYKVILGESSGNDCAQTAAQYASVRTTGQSHAQAVYGLRSLFNTINQLVKP